MYVFYCLDNDTTNETNTSFSYNTEESISNVDEFDVFLSSQSSVSTTSTEKSSTRSIKKLLHDFKDVQRIPYTTNILKYWESLKDTHHELHELACIVLAVPATQVSIYFF